MKQFNKIKNLQVQYRNPKKILLFKIPTINYSSFDIKSQKRSGYTTYLIYSYDGFWAKDLYPWDIAGGLILVNEAGGQ